MESAFPDHVLVYGNDHSPWVQAVLLGLHERGIAHTNVTSPPWDLFLEAGVLMPAARMDDGPWLLDSGRILGELGYPEVDPETRLALMKAFGSAASFRVDGPFEFWRLFSLVRDGHPDPARRYWNHFWRAFSIFYFFVLISVLRQMRTPPSDETLSESFAFFDQKLGPESEYFGGDAPTTVDLQLFGLVQMCATIPGPPLEVLRKDPKLDRLRAWIGTMHQRYADYPHLHSARDFEPRQKAIEESSRLDRACFWLGGALMWLALPVTLPLVVFFSWWIRRKGLVGA